MVSNKPGANGLVGLLSLNQSAPDGHTLGVSSPTDIEAILWETENGRKPAVNHDDFVYIGVITTSPHLLAVPYNSPWKTLADLIRDAKAEPGLLLLRLKWRQRRDAPFRRVFHGGDGSQVPPCPLPGRRQGR